MDSSMAQIDYYGLLKSRGGLMPGDSTRCSRGFPTQQLDLRIKSSNLKTQLLLVPTCGVTNFSI